jgi:glutathione S-transferase
MRIWGRPNSICTQRVLWACVECAVEFELVLASATMGPEGHVSTGARPFGIVDTPAYREMNPNGTVPTIDDDGYILWESNAIVCYLAMKYGPAGLWGGGAAGLAAQMKWMAWTNENLEPALHTLVMECVRLAPALRNPEEREAGRQRGVAALECLDAVLAAQPFMAGDAFGIADIPVACAAYRWTLFELATPPLPHVDDWLARVVPRAGFRAHVRPRDHHLA